MGRGLGVAGGGGTIRPPEPLFSADEDVAAFSVFYESQRGAVQAQHPQASYQELARLCAVAWRALPPAQKLGYVEVLRRRRGLNGGNNGNRNISNCLPVIA